MEQLVREGEISYVGSSNFAAWDVALAQSAATARHSLGPVLEQSHDSLAVRDVELELVDADALARLDEIWPGPETPQAYAW